MISIPTLKDVIYNNKNLEKLILLNKNWPNDVRVGCKSPNDLVEFIEMNEQLEEKLQEFEGEFGRLFFCICFVLCK